MDDSSSIPHNVFSTTCFECVYVRARVCVHGGVCLCGHAFAAVCVCVCMCVHVCVHVCEHCV